jgi:threonine synthase
MALSILPKFMKVSKEKNNEDKEIVILTATSGDTGKAALEGFANNEGIKIIVFFPTDGVSEVQKAQMVTQTGDNTFVVAINGNFDDAQSGVKEIFNDVEFNKLLDENGYVFSSANSINIGRLVPQIIYYFYGYFNLIKNKKIKAGDKINVVVPTGNFGNILASYYAFKMGLPVNKFICASNINNVLTDFLNTGIYDINRKFNTTISPSMDILISSNLERFIESLTDKDDKLISELMNSLKTNGKYELPNELKEKLNKFYGGYADDEATKTTIKSVFDKYSYVIDTHTAVAYKVYEDYIKETNDIDTKTLIASTASPFKFTRAVLESIVDKKLDDKSDFELIEELAKTTNLEIPKAVFELDKKEVLHKTVIDSDKMKDAISSFLKIK